MRKIFIKIILKLVNILKMENKFNRLDEVSFIIQDKKVYGIINSYNKVILEDDITYLYNMSLICPIRFKETTNDVYQIAIHENDLTLEKFPKSLNDEKVIII